MKLNDKQWSEIRTKYELGEPMRAIAREYDIALGTIQNRVKKEEWSQDNKDNTHLIKESLTDIFNTEMDKLKLINEIYKNKLLLERPSINKIENKRGLREKAALDTIEQLLGIKLIRQFEVGGFKIDGYDIENKIAYEIDEEQHNSKKHSQHDVLRQKFITEQLNCTFKRIKV